MAVTGEHLEWQVVWESSGCSGHRCPQQSRHDVTRLRGGGAGLGQSGGRDGTREPSAAAQSTRHLLRGQAE